MKFDFGLHLLFGSDKKKLIVEDESDRIILYTKAIVVREDLIKHILDRFSAAHSSDPVERVRHQIQTYLLLEDFIIKNKPMVVQKLYTKESLREEIRTKFDLQKLSEEFKLIFLPEKEQLFLLYTGYTKILSEYIINQLGITGLQALVSATVTNTAFAGIDVTNQKAMESLYVHLPDIPASDLTDIFQKVNSALYNNIAASFGQNTALELTQRSYQKVKETYNYDVISLFLQAVPAGVLDRERVAYMARDDLEKQALVAAEEKVRREMAEKSAQILEGEKAIIEEKVREQTAEITEEKEALKRAVEEINANYLQIQRTEAKLLASVKGLSLGFILTDTENNVITSNEAVKRILKITEDIKSIQDIATKMQDKVDLMAAIGQSKNDTMPVELKELEVLDAILHVTITPVFLTEPHKEYIGTVILIDDITEEKQLERTKDEFFAIASHELRTPLTAIRGSVSILKNYYADKITEGDIPTLITYIDQSSVHLIDIVNEFLNVSRLEQGRITFKNERFSLSDLVSQTVNEFRTLAEKKQLFLRYDNEGTQHSPVFADQDKTKQIFINLIGNAIKFTEHGGISVLTEEKDESVFVKITDTGLGIPTVNQKLLFRKFQQADPNILTHDASKGTGLGLYISKKLIENMSGSIFLERSEDGRGSTFTFSLPIAKDTA